MNQRPALPPMLTCRECGHRHYSATVCPVCKYPTPHFAVIKPKKEAA